MCYVRLLLTKNPPQIQKNYTMIQMYRQKKIKNLGENPTWIHTILFIIGRILAILEKFRRYKFVKARVGCLNKYSCNATVNTVPTSPPLIHILSNEL